MESIAQLSTTLDTASPYPESLAHSIIATTQSSQSLSQHLIQLHNLQRRLETELLSLRQQLQEIRSAAFQPPLSLQKQTLDWTRNTKQLRNKLGEYSDRLSTLQNSGAGAEVGALEVAEHEQRLHDLKAQVGLLEKQVEAFRGLPKNKDGARKEVERANRELEALKRQRDGLFEGLVQKG